MLAAASSKLPYYIAGGLLAAWAVLLAASGISHAEFPGSPSRARLVMLTSLLLVAATMTAAVVTGGEASEEHAGQGAAAPPATNGRPGSGAGAVASRPYTPVAKLDARRESRQWT